VTAPPGPSLVLAGAGSGKTRTLTYRVAYLVEQGVRPHRILLLTFTNKAANEMMGRVRALLDRDLSGLTGGTFHSVGHRLLRQWAELVGYERDFTILDREDSLRLLKSCYKEAKLDLKGDKLPKPAAMAQVFSLARNTMRPLEETIAEAFPRAPKRLFQRGAELWERYAQKKRQSRSMDFDDLLVLWLELLEKHPEAAERIRARFEHILVDEYQDTNALQCRLVDLMAGERHNVMAVGDDAQSIYSWRGADYENILRFPERHPGARIYRIETNYRSTPEILSLANAAIARNLRQYEKTLRPARPSGPKPRAVICPDAEAQAAFVAQRIEELLEEGVPPDRIAVLYRAHYHAFELQLELTRRRIPFSITSGIRFFEQAHVKDVAALLRWMANPRDEAAFLRMAEWFPGVGPRSAEKLRRAALERLAAAPAGSAAPGPAELAVFLEARLPAKAKARWARLAEALERAGSAETIPEKIHALLEGFYADYAREQFPEAESRLEDIRQLAEFAEAYESLEDFLGQLALLTNVEAETQEAAGAAAAPRLRLSTVHQAKGLEWRVVFVIMLAEGMFPSAKAVETQGGPEEERRLFYVAATRAQEQLYLVCPRYRSGRGGGMVLEPSSFLEELPQDAYELWEVEPGW